MLLVLLGLCCIFCLELDELLTDSELGTRVRLGPRYIGLVFINVCLLTVPENGSCFLFDESSICFDGLIAIIFEFRAYGVAKLLLLEPF